MPTYEYACQDCGHRFETFQSIKAEPLVDCPICEEKGLRRLIGQGAGIIFKGSGFYQTDYRKTSGKGGDKDGASSSSNDNAAKQTPNSGGTSEKKVASGAKASTE